MIHLSKKHYWILSIITILVLYITYALANWNYSDSSLIPSVSEQEIELMRKIEQKYSFSSVSVSYGNNFLGYSIDFNTSSNGYENLKVINKDSLKRIAESINIQAQPIVSRKDLADSICVIFYDLPKIKNSDSVLVEPKYFYTFPIKK